MKIPALQGGLAFQFIGLRVRKSLTITAISMTAAGIQTKGKTSRERIIQRLTFSLGQQATAMLRVPIPWLYPLEFERASHQ